MAKKADRDAVADKTLKRLKSFSSRLKSGEFAAVDKTAKKKCKLKRKVLIDMHCNNRTDVVRMQKNDAGRWYWYGWSTGNNKNTGTSGEDYSSRAACLDEAFGHAKQLGVPLEIWE